MIFVTLSPVLASYSGYSREVLEPLFQLYSYCHKRLKTGTLYFEAYICTSKLIKDSLLKFVHFLVLFGIGICGGLSILDSVEGCHTVISLVSEHSGSAV